MKTQIISEIITDIFPIAFPTETVYGLGAPVFDEQAIQKIFSIKGRPSDNPLIVHIGNLEDVMELAQNLPPVFFELAQKFWPGPLTLVVERHPLVPDIVTGGLPTVAIRMPSNPVARRLIQKTGPLVAPSANLSGKPSPTTAADVLEDLDGKISFILDGGVCSCGIESTVLNLVGPLTILRPGVILKEELEDFLKCSIQDADENTPAMSPGMKYRHYAPKAKVRLIYSQDGLNGSYILSPSPKEGMRLLNEKTLYQELRRADRCGAEEVLIDCSGELIENCALMNRLFKASSLEKN